MEVALWLIITIPLSALFTGLGIYAWKREKPMWFWSGSTVRERDISDVRAYNRANGVMWLCFSGVFWISAFLGIFRTKTAGAVLAIGCLAGIPALIIAYGKIYRKYKAKPGRNKT